MSRLVRSTELFTLSIYFSVCARSMVCTKCNRYGRCRSRRSSRRGDDRLPGRTQFVIGKSYPGEVPYIHMGGADSDFISSKAVVSTVSPPFVLDRESRNGSDSACIFTEIVHVRRFGHARWESECGCWSVGTERGSYRFSEHEW